MATNNSRLRVVREGVGMTGVTLNLSLAHLFFLAEMRERIKIIENPDSIQREAQALDIINQMMPVLDLIVGDIQHPYSPELWIQSSPDTISRKDDF